MARGVLRTISGGALAVLAASVFAACGGADRGRANAGAASSAEAGADPATECSAADGLTLQTITDFEAAPSSKVLPAASCDPSVNATSAAACMYLNYDTEQSPRACDSSAPNSPLCVQVNGQPEPDDFCMTSNFSAGQRILVSQIPGGRCGVSNYAFHLQGTHVAACYGKTSLRVGWGLTLQITFNPSSNVGLSAQVFDASSWDGISMWIKRGASSSQAALLASIEDPYSANAASALGFARPAQCTDGGTSPDAGTNCFIQCSTADPVSGALPAPDAEKCDPFGVGVGLTTDWRFVKIPFASVQQKGFGVPSPLGKLDTAALVGMQFSLNAGDWDVWIDDIAFYREPS